jgi:hypothetical protein
MFGPKGLGSGLGRLRERLRGLKAVAIPRSTPMPQATALLITLLITLLIALQKALQLTLVLDGTSWVGMLGSNPSLSPAVNQSKGWPQGRPLD